MKRIVPVVLAAALAVTLAGQALAQPDAPRAGRRAQRMQPRECRMDGRECRMERRAFAPRIEQRQHRQHLRLRRGAMAGRFAPGEVRRLRMHERMIHRMENRARCDGRFTLRERARVHRALDRQHLRMRRMGGDGRGI